MNISTFIILMIIVALFILAIRHIFKHGIPCSCGCSECKKCKNCPHNA